MGAYYCESGDAFLDRAIDDIVGRLAVASQGDVSENQLWSWRVCIETLKASGRALGTEPDGPATWSLLMEYPIPRRGRRVDAVLLLDSVVLVVEFKAGSSTYDLGAVRQVEDYALDLRDFHKESHDRLLVPLLCATEESTPMAPWVSDAQARVQPVAYSNKADLAQTILDIYMACHEPESEAIEMAVWNDSDYEPTPTIVEAAQALYAGHGVEAICQSHAGAINLSTTSRKVWGIVQQAKASGSKAICFVTGVPGSGKTLAGLNIIHTDRTDDTGALGAFLSGNGPLVRVLSEALARDKQARAGGTLAAAKREVRTFVQNVHHFIQHYVDDKPAEIPSDHVLVFDEAQRAWSTDKVKRQTRGKRTRSEPWMLLDAMDRRPDWAVIVALVGSGQEIHDGEAGLGEWGRTLQQDFPHWQIAAAPWAIGGSGEAEGLAGGLGVEREALTLEPDLHLRVSLRAFRANRVSEWADAVVSGDASAAMAARQGMAEYPVFLTRDLDRARTWLREQTRGTRRCGLVACSGAKRLRPWGVHVDAVLDDAKWFLGGHHDVRSSHYLELAATEFAIQGLELDWVGLCWGADYSRSEGAWRHRRFRGTEWQNMKDATVRQYLENKYRVLLTRAREGMVIWVPPGDPEDRTRTPDAYDETAEFLMRCGAHVLALDDQQTRAS